jgi:hypothetical protein
MQPIEIAWEILKAQLQKVKMQGAAREILMQHLMRSQTFFLQLWRDKLQGKFSALGHEHYDPQCKMELSTGCGSPRGYETSRLPHFLDTGRADDDEVVMLTRRRPFTPKNIPDTHFCERMSRPQWYIGLEGLGQLKNTTVISLVIEPLTFRLVT